MKRTHVFLLIINVLLLAWPLYLLGYVRTRSTSTGLDFLIILGWAAMVLAASWVEVQVILPKQQDPEAEVVKGRRLNLGRSLLLVVAIIANFAWTDLTAGDFWFSYYARFGVYATAMRSHDRNQRIWGLKRSAQAITPGFVAGMLPSVERLAGDKDPVVRGDAVAWLGFAVRQMNLLLAQQADVDVKKQARQVKIVLIQRLSDLATCLRREKAPGALQGCVYAAGWVSDPQLLGPLTDVVARARDARVRIAAAMACRDIGGLRALNMLADMARDFRGLARQAAVTAYLKAAAVLIDLKSPALNTPQFTLAEQRMAKVVPSLDKPALCAFLQHFPAVADARFSRAFAQVLMRTDAPYTCPDTQTDPPVGIPIALSLKRDFYRCLEGAVASIAKGNAVLIAAIRERIAKGGNARFMALLKGVLHAAGK